MEHAIILLVVGGPATIPLAEDGTAITLLVVGGPATIPLAEDRTAVALGLADQAITLLAADVD